MSTRSSYCTSIALLLALCIGCAQSTTQRSAEADAPAASNPSTPQGGSEAAAPATASQEGRILEHSEIAEPYTWDLTHIYADLDAWESDFADCEIGVGRLAAKKGTLDGTPTSLLAVFKLYDEVSIKLEKVYAYAMMLKDQDMRDSTAQALFDRVGSLGVKYGEALSWLQPEILAMPERTLREWCRTVDELAIYEHQIDDLLRQREHVLNAREEQLLAMGGKVASAPQQIFSMLTNADMSFPTILDDKGQEVELSEGRYGLYRVSADRGLRERAFKGTLQAYIAYKNAIAAMLAGSIQGDIYGARTHNYGSALEAALGPDNVPVAVYDNLIGTIREHLPQLHRYFEIRRKKLGIDAVHLYDTFVPLVNEPPPSISYDDAVRTIIEGLAPLGPEYLEPMKRGFESRWIDVYETQGKRSGAYSMGTYAIHPYILLNFNDTYEEMSTVAHEMGHSMHSWFTTHNQPPVYGDYPIFLAEVASTCNEIILSDYLRKNARSRSEKLFLVNFEIERLRGTVMTQTMWAEYEKLLHAQGEAGGALTYETMSGIYRDLVKDYYGPAYAHDEEVDGYWLRIPHFYRGFYVYKYATSYCASVALARGILEGKPGALERYMGFLKAGSSDYPIDILKAAGVDMSSPEPIAATMELFGELLDELEVLLEG